MDSSRQICRKLPNTSPASLDGEGDTVVLFSQGGAGENDIRLDCFFAGRCRQYLLLPEGFRQNERLRRVYRPRPLACGR